LFSSKDEVGGLNRVCLRQLQSLLL